jgi:pimeloyl-ACP methyl ester carboxylesterase
MKASKGWVAASVVGACAALMAAGCGLFYRAPAPIPSIPYAGIAPATERDLLVLLPGRGDHADSFAEQGIVQSARQSIPSLDVIAADATLGYYIHRNLGERLVADVIAPAKARGYRSIWLGGISMGGLGSLLFAQQNPGVVTDVILVAPFLGDDQVIDEIDRAGGLAAWQPANISSDDYQRDLWRWLKACTEGRQACPRILLGFGSADRFVKGHLLLAAALPPNQVAAVPGEHTWEPWRKLFAMLLPRAGGPKR